MSLHILVEFFHFNKKATDVIYFSEDNLPVNV